MPKRPSPQKDWEQALIDGYYDYRWRQVLQSLYDDFQRWASDELTHADMDQAIHQTHKKTQELYGLFAQSRAWLVRTIQFDEVWFKEWVRDHPLPARKKE